MKSPIIQISEKRTVLRNLKPDIGKLRAQFKRNHFARLPHFFPPQYISRIHRFLKSQKFYRRIHKDIATELCMRENSLFRELHFLVNDYTLFNLIEQITGCERLGCFTGRIYRMTAGVHHDSWHDDLTENRLIAMSVNISEDIYEGGCLLLRHKNKPQQIQRLINTGMGDALIFRLSKKLEHQVSNVEGPVPKTAYAGWFRARPDFLTGIKRLKKTARVLL